MLLSTIASEAAEHFCPACPNADCTKSFTATSISQQAVSTMAFLPLVSANRFNSFRQEENKSAVL